MRNARIWVLMADAVSARICSTEDGTTTPITAFPPSGYGLAEDDGREELLCRAWLRAEGRDSLGGGPVQRFAEHLAQILREGAREKAYDHFIVIATPEIAPKLDQALSLETRARLIGDIVTDIPQITASENEARQGLWH
jgi:hypothetical protein